MVSEIRESDRWGYLMRDEGENYPLAFATYEGQKTNSTLEVQIQQAIVIWMSPRIKTARPAQVAINFTARYHTN